jgi:O-antigen/teichoic acid export membrane protein
MPATSSLRRNIFWSLIGTATYASCQWGIVSALAHLTNPETVGRFALALAITAPIFAFSQLQLRGIQATDARREHPFSAYFGLRLLTTTMALILLAGIACGSGQPRSASLVILAVTLAKGCESVSDLLFGAMQRRERQSVIALSQVIKGVGSLVAFTLVLAATGELLPAALALTGVWAVVLVAHDLPAARACLRAELGGDPKSQFLPTFDPTALARLAWLAAPLGMVMTLISLQSNVPRYLIERELGTAQLGIFAALAYLIVVGSTIVGAIGQAASPRLANLHATGNRKGFFQLVWRLVGLASATGVAGVVVAAVAGPLVLRLMYGEVYAAHSHLLIALMAVGTLQYVGSVLGYSMTAMRCFRMQVPLFCTVLMTVAGASVALIPRYHLIGALLAVGLGAAVQVVGALVIMQTASRNWDTMISNER